MTSIRLLAAVPLALPAFLLVLSADTLATGDDPAEKKVELKRGDKVIFFGDSLTALAVKDARVPDGKGYVPLVREALKDKGVDVDAVATGGHKVTDLLKRVDKDVLAKNPTVVVIQIGVNDAGAGVTPEMFKEQLEELIGRLQKGGAKVIQCTCTCRREGYDAKDAFDKKLDALADAARKIAKDKNLPLIDLRAAFIAYWKKNNPDSKPNGVLTYDGNHWNETGHKYVAEQMLKKLQ